MTRINQYFTNHGSVKILGDDKAIEQLSKCYPGSKEFFDEIGLPKYSDPLSMLNIVCERLDFYGIEVESITIRDRNKNCTLCGKPK